MVGSLSSFGQTSRTGEAWQEVASHTGMPQDISRHETDLAHKAQVPLTVPIEPSPHKSLGGAMGSGYKKWSEILADRKVTTHSHRS